MAEIAVFGSFVMDNVATMDTFPQAGQSVIGNSLQLFAGGKGVNQCVAAARLGVETEMIGMLGDDANGETFRKILKDENIRCAHVYTCAKPTGSAQVQIDRSGQNRICVIPSANHEFGEREAERADEALKNCKILMAQLEMRYEITRGMILRAKSYGAKIILNPAPAAALDDELLAAVDYITPNESELETLSGIRTDTDDGVIRAAKSLIKRGAGCVVATLGSRGALICNKDMCEIIKGYRVKAVDTVAAGDSFNGAFAAALSAGKSLEECVRYANAMGALTVTVRGAIPSLHTKCELEKFIAENATY